MRWMMIVAVMLAAPAFAEETGRIVVSGEGQISAVPDMAVVRMGVTAEAKRARDAMAQVSETMTRVQQVLGAAGIEARDIQTTSLQLNPRWDNGPRNNGQTPKITGYFAENGISVRVRDLAGLGDVLGAVVTDGANQFRGLSFDIAEPEPLLDEARRAAVAAARAKAELLADAAGVSLGKLIEMREGGSPGPMPMMAEMRTSADSFSAPVAQGEMTLSATVMMVFAIE